MADNTGCPIMEGSRGQSGLTLVAAQCLPLMCRAIAYQCCIALYVAHMPALCTIERDTIELLQYAPRVLYKGTPLTPLMPSIRLCPSCPYTLLTTL